MRHRERRDSGQNDLFRARLDQIVDLDHALAKLGRAIDWRFLEQRFGAVYTDKVGHPPLPTRLMAGLSILKHCCGFRCVELTGISRSRMGSRE
jgi:IS5 family transposase